MKLNQDYSNPDTAPLGKFDSRAAVAKELQKRAKEALPVVQALTVKTACYLWSGIHLVTLDCVCSDTYKSLPAALTFEGKQYGKTGWNSDANEAYYRTDRLFAVVK